MLITPNMLLTAWTSSNDQYDHNQLATNWARIDQHDHSAGKGNQINGSTGIVAGSIPGTALAGQTISLSNLANGIARPFVNDFTSSGTAVDGELVVTTASGITVSTPTTPFLGSIFGVMIPHGNTAAVACTGSATMWLPAGAAAVTTTGSLSGFLMIRFVCYDGANWAVYGFSGTTAL